VGEARKTSVDPKIMAAEMANFILTALDRRATFGSRSLVTHLVITLNSGVDLVAAVHSSHQKGPTRRMRERRNP